MLQQALSAYNQCIEQGDLSPLDTFLKDEIIAKLCVPALNRLTATPGGGP
jgi:hypothetical protein